MKSVYMQAMSQTKVEFRGVFKNTRENRPVENSRVGCLCSHAFTEFTQARSQCLCGSERLFVNFVNFVN